MALVEQHTQDGQPLTVQLCDDVCWVPADKLRAACRPKLATGSRVGLSGVPDKPNSLGRKEFPEGGTVRADGDWVVLVTSKGTRSETKGTYFLACGKLGESAAEVSEGAWRAFRLAVDGADDLRKAEQAKAATDPAARQPTAPVIFGGQRIGDRRVVTGRLWHGDVIWVRTRRHATGKVTVEEVSLSAIWRHPGWQADKDGHADPPKWAAGTRVPRGSAGLPWPGPAVPGVPDFRQRRPAEPRPGRPG